ncbi:hypothetical protein GCM10010094_31060 [Streptomyces flaveus]|uniref:Uncharacterized protein n=1 Tax=Streptomyces flaveus TaxID=66370 RepID=A0A917QU43_9ACTN|nr:hypothetical protein GCM10010094_31060 [Streptomyces flaveus]
MKPAVSLRREGAWAGASYARRLASVSEDQGLVPGQGRMPGLRRADAPAHDPATPHPPRGAGNGATSHTQPAPKNEPTRPTAGGNRQLCEPNNPRNSSGRSLSQDSLAVLVRESFTHV